MHPRKKITSDLLLKYLKKAVTLWDFHPLKSSSKNVPLGVEAQALAKELRWALATVETKSIQTEEGRDVTPLKGY